jgi:cell division protein FtsW
MLGAIFILTALCNLFGTNIQGVKRWFDLGFTTIDASDLAILSVLVMGAYVYRAKDKTIKSVLGIMLLAGAVAVMLLIMPSRINAALIFFTALTVLTAAVLKGHLAVSRKTYFLALAGVLLLTLGLMIWFLAVNPYYLRRVSMLFSRGQADPYGAGYQMAMADKWLMNSALLGGAEPVGGKTIWETLPDAHSIYAIVNSVARFGWGVGAVIVAVIAAFIALGFRMTSRLKNSSGFYIALSAITVLSLKLVAGVLVNFNLLPTMGVMIPFFSYNSTSGAAVNALLLGVVFAACRYDEIAEPDDWAVKRGALGKIADVVRSRSLLFRTRKIVINLTYRVSKLKRFISLILIVVILTIIPVSAHQQAQAGWFFLDAIWDGIMLGVGAAQCANSVIEGNAGSIAIDCGGVAVDLAFLLIPMVPNATKFPAKLAGKLGAVTKSDDLIDILNEIAKVSTNLDDFVVKMKAAGINIPRTINELQSGKYLIGNYEYLQPFVSGFRSVIQRHHLNPVFIAKAFGLSPAGGLSVVIGANIHASEFTSELTALIKRVYGIEKSTDTAKFSSVNAIQYLKGLGKIYDDYPAMKYAAQLEFFMSKGGQPLRTALGILPSSAISVGKLFNPKLDIQQLVKDLSPMTSLIDFDLNNYSDIDFVKTINPAIDGFDGSYGLRDVTSSFGNMALSIKSLSTNYLLDGPNGSTVHADGKVDAGIYNTQLTSDGWIGFKSNNKWLSVQDSNFLKLTGDNLSSWECFKIYEKAASPPAQPTYHIMSQKTGKFLSVTGESAKPLVADTVKSYTMSSDSYELPNTASFTFEDALTGKTPNTGSGNNSTPISPPSSPVDNSPTTKTSEYYYLTEYVYGTYTGQWMNGKPEGEGTLVYAQNSKNRTINGYDRYVGSWKSGQVYGYGTIFTANPSEVDGIVKLSGEFYGLWSTRIGQIVQDVYVHYQDGDIYHNVVYAATSKDPDPNKGIWEQVVEDPHTHEKNIFITSDDTSNNTITIIPPIDIPPVSPPPFEGAKDEPPIINEIYISDPVETPPINEDTPISVPVIPPVETYPDYSYIWSDDVYQEPIQTTEFTVNYTSGDNTVYFRWPVFSNTTKIVIEYHDIAHEYTDTYDFPGDYVHGYIYDLLASEYEFRVVMYSNDTVIYTSQWEYVLYGDFDPTDKWTYIQINSDAFIYSRASDWAIDPIMTLEKNGYAFWMFDENYFKNITRQEFAELIYYGLEYIYGDTDILLEREGVDKIYRTFKDVPDETQIYRIEFLRFLKIVDGTTESTFNPDGYISRQEAATMLNRFFNYVSYGDARLEYALTPVNLPYRDNSNISVWAQLAVSNMGYLGVMSGIGNSQFGPNEKLSVEQTLVSIYRLLFDSF